MTETITDSALDHADYAGFWMRFLASCIDLLLLVPFYLALKLCLSLVAGHGTVDASMDYAGMEGLPNSPLQWCFEGIFDVMALLLYAWFFSSRWQGSPGMYLMKFHVCDSEGRRITFLRGFMWCITALCGVAVCFAGVLYLEKDIFTVRDMWASCQEQNIALADCIPEIEKEIGIPFSAFQQLVLSATGITFFMCVIWALSIALPKDKTGFHNLLCGTRFVKGRVRG